MKEFTISQAMEWTGYSRNTLSRYVRGKKVVARQDGDTTTAPWLIPAEEVERLRVQRLAELQQEIAKISRPVPLNGSASE